MASAVENLRVLLFMNVNLANSNLQNSANVACQIHLFY